MNNEELILAELKALRQEVQELKNRGKPLAEFRATLEPILRDLMGEAIEKLEHLGDKVSMESLEDLIANGLAASGSLAEGLKLLNGLMDLKHTAEPIVRQALDEAIAGLDSVAYRFSFDDLGSLLRQSLLNMGNLAEGLRLLSAGLELKSTVGDIPKIALDEVTAKLEDFRQQGGFVGLDKLHQLGMTLVCGLAELDLTKVKPVKGIFALLGALKRPEVQQGLGLAMELAGALGHNKGVGSSSG